MNAHYRADILNYQKKDAITAICFWVLLMVSYAVAGYAARFIGTLIPGIVVSVLPFVACIAIVVKKGDGVASLGFRKEGFKASLALGLACGLVALVVNNGILPAIIYGWKLEPIGYVLYRFFYYLISIALVEETIFRGYIQTRLYGLLQNKALAMSLGALMFALMHVPFQIAIGNQIWGLSLIIWLASTFIWHFAFDLMFKKHYSLVGPTLFHTIMNWSSDIFARDTSPMWSGYALLVLTLCVLAAIGIKTLRNNS